MTPLSSAKLQPGCEDPRPPVTAPCGPCFRPAESCLQPGGLFPSRSRVGRCRVRFVMHARGLPLRPRSCQPQSGPGPGQPAFGPPDSMCVRESVGVAKALREAVLPAEVPVELLLAARCRQVREVQARALLSGLVANRVPAARTLRALQATGRRLSAEMNGGRGTSSPNNTLKPTTHTPPKRLQCSRFASWFWLDDSSMRDGDVEYICCTIGVGSKT